MKEDLLHYLWKFKKFDTSNLQTVHHESIQILNSGQYLQVAGPDFFNAQIMLNQQKWAGNIELHLKSSDWYLHHHERDPAYENVILHVVWEHDSAIFRKDNSELPTLVLKTYVSEQLIQQYEALLFPKSWIYCERQLEDLDSFVIRNWQERLFLERLEAKLNPIETLLEETQNDWEAVLFCMLAKNFGLNTNGELFYKMATEIPFAILRKERVEFENIEALLFGKVGLLNFEKEDTYFHNLKSRYEYLKVKYQMQNSIHGSVQFFKHRPDNFPTIRLSQLANLYAKQDQLFSKINHLQSINDVYALFNVAVAPYWQTHYQFDATSPKKTKALSKSFIDLIVINTVVPLQFAYAKRQGKDSIELLMQLLEQIAPEKNTIVEKFNALGISTNNAFQTQSLLQLKKDYCNKSRCLECAIGTQLLKSK